MKRYKLGLYIGEPCLLDIAEHPPCKGNPVVVRAEDYDAIQQRAAGLETRNKALAEAAETFLAIMDSDEDGGEGIFEEAIERLVPIFRAALAAGDTPK